MSWSDVPVRRAEVFGGPMQGIAPTSGVRVARMSLAGRLALVNAVIALITIAIAGCVSYLALARELDRHADAELWSKAQALAHTFAELPDATSRDAWQQGVRTALYGHEDLHVAIVDGRNKEALFASSALAEEALTRIDWRAQGVDPAFWQFKPSYPVASVAMPIRLAQGDNLKVVLSQDRSREELLLARFTSGVIAAFLALWALLLVGSWWIARLELAPLERFSQMAARTGAGSLGHRLELNGLPRELAVLADEFNSMLVRIEQGMERISNFSGDLAHELRTPIGILYGRTQVALSRGRTEDELRQVLEDNVLELERLSRLVSDMLFIAQEAESNVADLMTKVDFRKLAEMVTEFMSLAAEERGIVFAVTGDAGVIANEVLIQRALTNLISNAIKHADTGSSVRIQIGRSGNGAAVEVINQGEPIPAIQLKRIFERFYRLDASRTRQDGGTGLGLAIVDAIAKRHGGRVSAECGPGRETRFRLELPDQKGDGWKVRAER
ncbi:MAG: heavy metal sensor histidine kinase [Betaproteobacteria bacterium]|nr:heavy metal sensor histidine kinase [Betaproteobacteria bacterium]